jgi:hypothetical protein
VATLPASPSGKVSVTTAGGTATSTASFTVTPGAIAAAAVAHPGAKVVFNASGLDAYASMDVYFDTTDVALTVTNSNGIASTTVTLPSNATPGLHYVTFDERHGTKAVQAAITINTDWLQASYSPSGDGLNPYEGALNTSTVSDLDTLWSGTDGGYDNATPLVVASGTVFAADVNGVVRAYGPGGTLTWTANPGGWLAQRTPVIFAGKLFVSNATTVFAYKTNCATKGATCTPVWTASVPVSIGGGLSQYGGMLYASGSDGYVYPIDPTTGAVGTPFFVYTASSSGITSPISFSADGSYAYASGSSMRIHLGNGGASVLTFGNNYISGVAMKGNLAFYEVSDGTLHEFGGKSWSATLSGTYCESTPAVAYGMVYAGDCNDVWGFNEASGGVYWTFAGGYVLGISVANHVVYACANYAIVALDASNGTPLWTGGYCSGAPVVANGTVFSADANVYAFTIPSLTSNAVPKRPVIAKLKPDLHLVAQFTPE